MSRNKVYLQRVQEKMDSEAFRKHGKEMIDFVADYWDSIRERQPLPDVQPGFIWDLVRLIFPLLPIS